MGDAMCGIVACRTSGKAAEFLLPALAQLEYRGYDSAGVAVGDPDAGDLNIVRAAGRLPTPQREVTSWGCSGRQGASRS
jgi:glucosamine--fructose-6-phosphate aminotransferase (isomerizing)